MTAERDGSLDFTPNTPTQPELPKPKRDEDSTAGVQGENGIDVTDQQRSGAVWVSIVTIIRTPDLGASR